jgi:hypothetical protein
LGAPATIEIVAVDSNGNEVAKMTIVVKEAGVIPADISQLFNNQITNSRRARQVIIGGKAVTFTRMIILNI